MSEFIAYLAFAVALIALAWAWMALREARIISKRTESAIRIATDAFIIQEAERRRRAKAANQRKEADGQPG